MTKSRCIEHTDKVDAKEYKSTSHDTLVDPRQRPESMSKQSSGPKARLIQNKLNAIIAEESKQKTLKETIISKHVDYTTETKANFIKEGFRHTHALSEGTTKKLPGILNDGDLPITLYSHSFSRGKFPFPSTFVASSKNPFAKSDKFSSSTSFDPRVQRGEILRSIPTVTDFMNLESFKLRLLSNIKDTLNFTIPGRSIRYIFSLFWEISEGNEFIPLEALLETLREKFGFISTSFEKASLITSFGESSTTDVSFDSIMLFFRKRPYNRRLELINLAFQHVSSNSYQVNENSIRRKFLLNYVDELLFDMKLISDSVKANTNEAVAVSDSDELILSKDDFIDFYVDASSEIENDLEFESLLIHSWGLN